MGKLTTVAEAHETILLLAADIANRMLKERDDLPRAFRVDPNPFRPVPPREQKGTLSLMADTGGDPNQLPAAERRQIQKITQEIGTAAIKQAILDNRDLFVGLIVGSAKRGRNYFDYFEDEDQLKLL